MGKNGHVYLVGAGCGKGLITVEGLRVLKSAEVLVYDDLIDEGLLSEAPEDAVRLYVGKRAGRHSKKQDEINQILIENAGKGKRVVRLKGGDAFVFGRGGEEYKAVTDAGYSCSVIPGVSSAIAVPEHVGIPVTHRGVARSFTVVTGHTMDGRSEDFEALAHLKGTIVFLMGLHSCAHISEQLIKYGKSPDTFASIISKGFSHKERRYDTTLADLAHTSEQAESPAVIVIGDTAGMHFSDEASCKGDRKVCLDDLPLYGTQIAVTGTESFSEKTAEVLRGYGAEAEAVKTMEIVPEENPDLCDTEQYRWLVFTSPNGIKTWFGRLLKSGLDLRELYGKRIAVIGRGTADTLRGFGLTADFIPTEYTAFSLGRQLALKISSEGDPENDRVLILRAANGSKMLTEELYKAGIAFEDRAVYRVVSVPDAYDRFSDCDYVVFGSAGGVRAFFKEGRDFREGKNDVRLVAIGRYTAGELVKHTRCDIITAHEFCAEGIAKAIINDRRQAARGLL